MNAKEKSLQLIEMFSAHTDCAGDQATSHEAKQIQLIHAKKASIICVEQVLKQLNEMRDEEFTAFWHGEKAGETIDGINLKAYWNEVKDELNLQPI